MNEIMRQDFSDDLSALLAAKAMTKLGAEVFAITWSPNPRSSYIVWARVRDNAHIDEIDTAIEEDARIT